MSDQANDLRRLVIERVPADANRRAAGPPWIVVAGGKGGVGTTTVAMHLAMADEKRKTLLIDADPRGGDLALRCGLDDCRTLGDVLTKRSRLAEVIAMGPGGMPVVLGARNWDELHFCSDTIADRLVAALEDRGVHAHAVVINVGNWPSRAGCGLWRAADAAIVVANAESAGIVGAYEVVKRSMTQGTVPPTFALVNMAASPEIAANVYGRLATAARRFLGIRLADAGHFPLVSGGRLADGGDPQLLGRASVALNACRSAVRQSRAA